MTKPILILGAGIEQTIAIKLAKEIGLKVIVVDGNPDAPGLKIADVGINEDILHLSLQIDKKASNKDGDQNETKDG